MNDYVLIILLVFTLTIPILTARMNLPFVALLGRWFRWFLFAGLFSFFLNFLEISFRPDWVHFITGLSLWFVCETGYNWIAIKALSRSELPLFPVFKNNNDGDEWPADRQFIDLKDWLKGSGFSRINVLKAELFEGTFLRSSIYESEDQLTRIQILFLPKRQGGSSASYTIQSTSSDGVRWITDNQSLPYGGYYPENWKLCRRPLVGSLKSLLKLHEKRIRGSAVELAVPENDGLEELNEQQRILERLNTESGFLVPRPQQEESGKISSEGCYRLWKEMWVLAYLGRSVSW